MALFTVTNAKSIKEFLIDKAQEGCNTTLYPGDERRIFIESVITPLWVSLYNVIDDVARQKMRKYARGEVLDAIGGEKCKRLEAEKATTTLQFYTNEPAKEDIIIPVGTTVTTNDDHDFTTDEEVILKMGETNIHVTASASSGGSEYNDYAIGTIAVIVDDISVDGCKNITISSGGNDGEPYDSEGDDRYRERIALHEDAESTCGTETAYRYYALTADSTVADVNVISPAEYDITSDYDVIIYIICQGGNIPDSDTLNLVQSVCDDKEHRPMCDHIHVEPAEQVNYSVDIKVYVGAADIDRAPDIVSKAVNEYIKKQDETIASAINPDQLFAKVMKATDSEGNYLDIERCVVTSPTYTELAYNKVGKCKSINISYVNEG